MLIAATLSGCKSVDPLLSMRVVEHSPIDTPLSTCGVPSVPGLPRRLGADAGWAWGVPDQTAKKAFTTGPMAGCRVYWLFAVIELICENIDILCQCIERQVIG